MKKLVQIENQLYTACIHTLRLMISTGLEKRRPWNLAPERKTGQSHTILLEHRVKDEFCGLSYVPNDNLMEEWLVVRNGRKPERMGYLPAMMELAKIITGIQWDESKETVEDVFLRATRTTRETHRLFQERPKFIFCPV